MSRKPQIIAVSVCSLLLPHFFGFLPPHITFRDLFGVDSFLIIIIIIIIITIIICVKRTFLHKYNQSHLRFVNLIIVEIINKIVQTLALLF